MGRGSSRRAGTPPWRVRAFGYPSRIASYLAAALRLRRSRRQEQDPDPDVRPEEPMLAVAAAVMTSATVATTVVAGQAVQPHLVQARNNAVMVRSGPLAPGVSAIFMGEPSAPPLDPHLNNARDRELEVEAARQEWLGGPSHPEVLTFGDVRLTRGQLNRCQRLTQDLVDIVRTVNNNRTLGVGQSDEMNIRVQGNVNDLIRVLTSFTKDPRDRVALLRLQPNNGNIFIESRPKYELKSVTRNNLIGSAIAAVDDPPNMRVKDVNQTRPRTDENSEEDLPNNSEHKFNRTKARVHFEELQNENVETNEEPDGEAPEASREEASHELGAGASNEEGRVDVDFGTSNRQATRLQQADAQPGEDRCRDEIEGIFEPRPLRSQTLPTTRSGDALGYFHKDLKKYIDYSSVPADDWCYGEKPRAEKRVTPKKGLLAKSAAAISTAAHKLSKAISCSSEDIKKELFPNPMYTFTKSTRRRYADYEDEAGPSTVRYYWEREDGAGNYDEQSDYEENPINESRPINTNNKTNLLVNEPDLGVKKKVAPAKPPRSSFRGSTSGRYEARAIPETPPPEYSTLPRSNVSIKISRSSPSPTQMSSEQSEDDLQDTFKLSIDSPQSSPPLSVRSASVCSTFSIKSTCFSSSPTPSEPENAEQLLDEFQPNDTGSKFEFPMEGVTRSVSPPPPALPSPPTTPPAAFRSASRRITLFHSFPNLNLPGARPMQVLGIPIRETAIHGSPPPTPRRTSASTSAPTSASTASTYISNSASTSASISDDEPGPSRPTGSRPAGDLPEQQNSPPEEESEQQWMFMDESIMLQHGTIPFPTTYKRPK